MSERPTTIHELPQDEVMAEIHRAEEAGEDIGAALEELLKTKQEEHDRGQP